VSTTTFYTTKTALIVALGGFLMGFDASVISGVVSFIEPQFSLTKIELGWSVASLTLAATIAMSLSGPLSDRVGRKPVLLAAAMLFLVSAILSAVAPTFAMLVTARLLAGLAVGAALLIAPMYIAEISPPALRGRLVSFNQLNIVLGISAAFFSNYLIVRLGHSGGGWARALMIGPWNWRWMLGIEAAPAAFYFAMLFGIPESPRWLAMQGHPEKALQVLARFSEGGQAETQLDAVLASLRRDAGLERASIRELWQPAMKLVISIGVSLAVLQQITGINAVFFYAPMIFEQSGAGADASFMQAVLVGLVNLAFTLLAIVLIDRVGRRLLLAAGVTGIAICMLLLSYEFGSATYELRDTAVASLPQEISRTALQPLVGNTYNSDIDFRDAVVTAVGAKQYQAHRAAFVSAAIHVNPTLILIGLLGFVASFAVSLGPVMWVVFSELFPNRIRGLAISFVGLINSVVSFTVQLVFPWELERIGNSVTFLIYGVFAMVGLFIVMKLLPETKGRSLEELELSLVRQ
jgi:SP family arabinose:H+ symporter-like MFS transporter